MNFLRDDYTLAIEGAGPDGANLPIRAVLGVGRNYAAHAKERGADLPERPMIFTKSCTALCLSGDAIMIPRACQDREQVDFEGELAVIIGTPTRDVTEAAALEHVLGYAIANDVSARWWQKEGAGGQFHRGKSFDTFCPIGPRVTPAREIANPQGLTIRTTVSGEEMQSASTGQMIFSVAYLIAELSRGRTLAPGTVILTGTPAGVGAARQPARFLREDDVVEIEIEGLGKLENRVAVEA